MAKVFNAAATTAKWKRNYVGSTEAYKAGIQGVTVAPGVQAAAASQKWADNVAKAAQDGTFADAVGSVPLSVWQNNAITTGVQRMASGANKGEQKFNNYMTAAAPTYQDIRQTAASMPNDGSDESALNIMRMNLQKMRTLKGAGRRR